MPINKTPIAEAPKPRVLTDLRVHEYGIEPATQELESKIVQNPEYAKELAKRWAEGVVKLHDPTTWEDFLHTCSQMHHLELIHLGYRHNLGSLGESYNHEYLVSAAECILRHRSLLQHLVALSLRDLDLNNLSDDIRTLKFLRAVLASHEATAEKLKILLSHVQKSVDQKVRQVAAIALPAARTTRDLNEALRPLNNLINGPAENAQETKKAIAKALSEKDKPQNDE